MTKREQRDRGNAAGPLRCVLFCICKRNHHILIDTMSLDSSSPPSRPHRDGKIQSSDILCSSNQKVSATFTKRVIRHGMIKPVLPLYSFLRPSCFLDWVPYRHHQAQIWLSNEHLHDFSMARPSGCVVAQASLFPPIKYRYFLRIRPDAREHGEW